MKTAKVIIGLVIGLFATTTMFQMLTEESGAGLFGALTGYVLIMAFCVWLVYSGSKSKNTADKIIKDDEDNSVQKTTHPSAPTTDNYKKLKDLYESGILTKEEFEAKTQTVVPTKETKNNGSVKTIFIILIILGLVGFGVSQKDEILRFVNGTTKTTQKPQINNTVVYKPPPVSKKYVFAYFKIQPPPDVIVPQYSQTSLRICNVSEYVLNKNYGTDIIEVVDYNEDKKYMFLDEAEKQLKPVLAQLDREFKNNLKVCYNSEVFESFLYKAKIIEREVMAFSSYSEASKYKRSLNIN